MDFPASLRTSTAWGVAGSEKQPGDEIAQELFRKQLRETGSTVQGSSNITYEEMMTPGVACVVWGDVGDGFSSPLLTVASHERHWMFCHQRGRIVEVPTTSLQNFHPETGQSTGARLEAQRLMDKKNAKATLAKETKRAGLTPADSVGCNHCGLRYSWNEIRTCKCARHLTAYFIYSVPVYPRHIPRLGPARGFCLICAGIACGAQPMQVHVLLRHRVPGSGVAHAQELLQEEEEVKPRIKSISVYLPRTAAQPAGNWTEDSAGGRGARGGRCAYTLRLYPLLPSGRGGQEIRLYNGTERTACCGTA